MNSKNWKSLMVWLRANTTAQPHEIETPEDALAVAFLKLAAVNPLISGFDVPDAAVYTQQIGRAKRPVPIITDFADPTKEFLTVPHTMGPSKMPSGTGWTLHSSTSFDATWVRDAKVFDCHRWPGCGCPDGTVAADCPGETVDPDSWRGVTLEDVGKRFLVMDSEGYVTIGVVRSGIATDVKIRDIPS